jgi:hypothetical protein
MKNYCSMIHGGLRITFDDNNVLANHCCLRNEKFKIDDFLNFWNSEQFENLRRFNLTDQWDSGCSNCQLLENSGLTSFRNGMNNGLEIYGKTNISGPARIDLKFTKSCNLACRICGPDASTYWQKHLRENNKWNLPISPSNNKNIVIDTLSKLDLTNLRMLVFCGGETLLGQDHWDVAEWFVDNVPHAKQNLTICFQTNATQTILPKNYKIIEKCHLVKLHFSLDGIEEQFDYMRWPASWAQVTDNLFELRENLPSNTMFVIEETISVFNLRYLDKLQSWYEKNFTCNREGDTVDKTQHLVNGVFDIRHALTQEYVNVVQNLPCRNLIDANWKEQPDKIRKMIEEIRKFDGYRNQDWTKIFPEVSEFYYRYL